MYQNNSLYFSTLQEWGDALLKLQINNIGNPYLDGGILCPSCKHMHGRCPDAIYGFMCLAGHTGDEKYLNAARQLFRWHENLICDDGTAYNDSNSAWNGITTFSIISLHEALVHYGHLLGSDEKKLWEARMLSMSRWVSKTIRPGYLNNINYLAASAAVQALVGKYFDIAEYIQNANILKDYVMERFTENGLLYGEGIPHDHVTERGCNPVDIGYNVEESIPLLIRYALAIDDKPMLEKMTVILRQQLEFMLPDGAWDNSFGTRNNKWTYYGSRTSDGCQSGYALLADRDPIFAEAAMRNLELMKRCTHNGLLYGGVEYPKHNEPPCSHHSLTHINALAAAIDAGIEKYNLRCALPTDSVREAVHYFPEIDTYKLSIGDWRSTVTGFDFWLEEGHASGGTMSLLWHKKVGPILLSSAVSYQMVEPLNMQLTLNKQRHRSLTPRIQLLEGNKQFLSAYDKKATINVDETPIGIHIKVETSLVSIEQENPKKPIPCCINYLLTEEMLTIDTEILSSSDNVKLILPIIAQSATVVSKQSYPEPEHIFFLTGGFGAREFIFSPDNENKIHVEISLS